MNLLKQTALVLGLVSLSLGSWTLYRNWRQKIAILFSILCFCIAIWALSFVSYATLGGRLPKDIHWFMNIWISPIGVSLLAKILLEEDGVSRLLRWISFAGASVLSFMVSFSMGHSPLFWLLVSFWPSFILLQYLNVMVKHLIRGSSVSIEFISSSKRFVFYLGLALCMLFCTFDHIPSLGFVLPSLGNLFCAIYLGFASQVISPQKLLGMEALVTRFFATLILSLIITGFFALMYQYVSTTFPLFLLNSFLISFSVLVLWNPLLTFLRFVAKKISRTEGELRKQQFEKFKFSLESVTDIESLLGLIESAFKLWMEAETRLVYDEKTLNIPEAVVKFFSSHHFKNETPILHKELILLEKDQVITQERRKELGQLIRFLEANQSDTAFPIFQNEKVMAIIFVTEHVLIDEWRVNLGFYSKIYEVIQEVGPALVRLTQIEQAKEKERLMLMGEMAAGLAHEIRNPLGAIRGAAQLIDEDSSPWAKVIQEEVSRLNRLVSQFLDFSYSPKDLPENIHLIHLIETTLQTLKNSIPQTISLRFDSGEFSELRAWGVPDHLQQIIINLVQNAAKALSGIQDPKIEIQVFETGFKVIDNGIGMTGEIQNKIFQPFFTTFKEGSGLGLSICQRLVKFNQGTITVKSTLGVGTEFTVEVPHAR